MEWKKLVLKLPCHLQPNKRNKLIQFFNHKTPHVHAVFENTHKEGNFQACVRTASNLGIQGINFVSSIPSQTINISKGSAKFKDLSILSAKEQNHTSGGYSKWVDVKNYNSFEELTTAYKKLNKKLFIVSTALDGNSNVKSSCLTGIEGVLENKFGIKNKDTYNSLFLYNNFNKYNPEDSSIRNRNINDYGHMDLNNETASFLYQLTQEIVSIFINMLMYHEFAKKEEFVIILSFVNLITTSNIVNQRDVISKERTIDLLSFYNSQTIFKLKELFAESLLDGSLFHSFKLIYKLFVSDMKINKALLESYSKDLLNTNSTTNKSSLTNSNFSLESNKYIRNFDLLSLSTYFSENHLKNNICKTLINENIDDTVILVCFGNELRGLSSTFIKNSDLLVKIPEFGFEGSSFNLSVSFTIVMYHLNRCGILPGVAFDFKENEWYELMGKTILNYFMKKGPDFFSQLGITDIEGL